MIPKSQSKSCSQIAPQNARVYGVCTPLFTAARQGLTFIAMLRQSLSTAALTAILAVGACATQSQSANSAQPEGTSRTSAPALRSASTVSAPHVMSTAAASVPATITPRPVLTRDQKFSNWKEDFVNRAIARGHNANVVRALILPAKINDKALDRDSKQPEFTKPIWSYVDGAASADRLNKGKAKLAENVSLFNSVENRYKVSRNYLTAIWGLESAYGKIMGNHNIVDALATFAHDGRRKEFGENQLFAILDMIKRGDIRQDQLKGSWAGAMGMTQFIPATMRDYAVDFDGNRNIDLRGSKADALGSAAHYLSRHGWKWGEPAMTEISLPAGFDYSLAGGEKRSVSEWEALGVKPIGGQIWSAAARNLDGKLLIPAGHKGPKFLTFKNFDVIKKYNNSTSYAMGITKLAETFQGRRVITTPWPRGDKQISFTQKKQLQSRLTALGYDTKGVDGQIGPNSRRAIRAWQKANGLVADGYVNLPVWNKIMGR